MPAKGIQRRKTVQEILLERKFAAEDKIKAAEEEAKKGNKSFQQAVLDLKLMTKTQLLKALSEEWQVKAVDLSQMDVDKEIMALVPESVARRHVAVPFAKEEGVLFLAMADPQDFFACENIHLRTGLEVKPYLALPESIQQFLDASYGKADSEALNRLVEQVQETAAEAPPEAEGVELAQASKSDIAEIDPSAPEVEKIANAIVLNALGMRASDIHIEPFEDPAGKNSRIRVRYRVDGVLREGKFSIPWAYRQAVIAKIKIMTETMDITERRIPQTGRITLMAKGNPILFRVEMIPTIYGESCVMRVMDRKAMVVEVDKLGFLPEMQEKFLGLLQGIGGKKNYGLILVCGPSGSGKSTTLYAALNYIKRPDIKIWTAENPVEFSITGIVQVPVNPDIKLGEDKRFDFAASLRSFLRLDPDVIMVGEIRDDETAQIAMEAAMTGHLVFATLHTNDAPAAISRLVEMGLPPYLVADTLKAVMAQRLTRRLCPDCKQAYDPPPQEAAVFEANKVELPKGTKLFKAAGCSNCKDIGFRGRIGTYELMVASDNLRAACHKNVSGDNIREAALKDGMRLIIQDSLEKVKLGMTTLQEAMGGGG